MVNDTLREVGNDPLLFLHSLTRQYGDVVRCPTSCGPVYILNHPKHVARVFTHPNYQRAKNYPLKIMLGNGLLTSEGEQWRRNRRLMQPEFHQERVAGMGPLVTASTSAMLERWQASADRGEAVNVTAEMCRLILEIAFKDFFSDDIDDRLEGVREALNTLSLDVGDFTSIQLAIPIEFSPGRNQRCKAALQYLDDVIFDIIERRRRKPVERRDTLSLLLGKETEDGNAVLNPQQLRDEVRTLLFAGSDSSTRMLTWMWHLLGENPAAEKNLYVEASQVLAGRFPDAGDLPHLTYTRMVFDETLRLYPPVWALFRQAMQEDEVGGYTIEGNTAVVVSAYLLQRHPDYWEEPEAFMPERFAPGSAALERYTYFPFGGGQHLCMGNHFALIEAQFMVAAIVQRYRLRPLPGRRMVPLPSLTLRSQDDLWMTLESRPTPTVS